MRRLTCLSDLSGPTSSQNPQSSCPLRYFALLKWMHFQPSRLKHYLWQADPELYSAQGLKALSRSLADSRLSGSVSDLAVLVVVLSAGLAWITPTARGTPHASGRVLYLACLPVSCSACFAVVGGLAFGAAFGAMFGPTFGVCLAVRLA